MEVPQSILFRGDADKQKGRGFRGITMLLFFMEISLNKRNLIVNTLGFLML